MQEALEGLQGVMRVDFDQHGDRFILHRRALSQAEEFQDVMAAVHGQVVAPWARHWLGLLSGAARNAFQRFFSSVVPPRGQ